MTRNSVLVIGYGNPGRRDDGLGPALADALEKENLPLTTVESDYQLTIEDAELASRHERVVFADASVDGPAPFFFKRVHASDSAPAFTTHHVEPADVLAIARDVFNVEPEAYVIGVRGYEFNEFEESLSASAAENLAKAVGFVTGVIRNNLYEDAADSLAQATSAVPAPNAISHTKIRR